MKTDKDSRYDSFEGFVLEIIEERSRQGKPVDNWIAAVAAILGPSPMAAITKALNITAIAGGAGMSVSTGLAAALPVLGAITGAVTGILMAKYIAKAHSKEGTDATRVLKKAESMYRNYSVASIDDADKRELINDLFKDVLEGKEPQ